MHINAKDGETTKGMVIQIFFLNKVSNLEILRVSIYSCSCNIQSQMLHTISNSFHIYKKKCEYFTNTINCNDPYVLTIKAIFRDSSLMANALKIILIEQRHDLTFSPMQQRM